MKTEIVLCRLTGKGEQKYLRKPLIVIVGRKDTLTISVPAMTVSYHAVTVCTDCKCALTGNAVSVYVMVTLVATDGGLSMPVCTCTE